MRAAPIVATLAVVLALGAGWWLGRASRDDVPAPPANATGTVGTDATAADAQGAVEPAQARATVAVPEAPAAAPAAGSPPPTARLPLPPADTPLAQIRDTLEQRARAGDAAAACRLGHELLRCQSARFQSARMRNMDQALANRPRDFVDANVESLARIENALERSREVCEGVAAEDTYAGFDWLQQAAARGNLAALGSFARFPPIPPELFVAQADRLVVWRDRAPGYAQQALERGDPRVLGTLAAGHFAPQDAGRRMPFGNPLQSLVPVDNARAYAYALLADRYFPPRAAGAFEFNEQRRIAPLLEAMRRDLEPADLAAGEALAAELAATSFRNTQPAPTKPTTEGTNYRCEE